MGVGELMGALRILGKAAAVILAYLIVAGPVADWYRAQTCDSRLVIAVVAITGFIAYREHEDKRPRV